MKSLGYVIGLILIGLILGCGSGGDKNEPINKGDYTTKPPQNRPHTNQPAGANANPAAPN